MRNLKFRAWHDVNNAFIYADISDIWINGVECVRCGAYSGDSKYIAMEKEEIDSITFVPNAKWEQFTGCYDENGKEIYEGDIIGGWGEVVYEASAFCIHGDPMHDLKTWKLIVIGNIHETPELLK